MCVLDLGFIWFLFSSFLLFSERNDFAVGLSIKSVLGEIDMVWCDKKNLSIRQGKGKAG